MTDATTEDDVARLRSAVVGVLGTGADDAAPVVDLDWRARWPALAELGLAALCVAESSGGFGLQVPVAVGTAQELGAGLHGGPFAGLTAAGHLLGGSDDPVVADLLAGLVAGERVVAFGVLDRSGTTAWNVDGAPGADALVVVDGSASHATLFAESGTWTVGEEEDPFDVSRSAADVTVDPSAGRPLPEVGIALDLFRLLLASDAVGSVARMHDRTVAYAGQRVAFGTPIGGFQAVQHRLADHAVRVRGTSLLVTEAGRLLAAGDPGASRLVALAGVSVATAATPILHDLLQLTGGIGFTWEYGLHLHERRVHQDARLVGAPRAAVRALAGVEGWSR